MKKLSILVLFVMILAVCLTSCGHEHEFSADWSKNDTQHWNVATCEHSEEVANKANHVDINNDKVCDTCAYDYNHTHTYEQDTWTYDAANHWQKATCGCTIAPVNTAAHQDADNDGACDVCGHIASHTHVYAEAWTTDAENHWHASLCGHDVVSEKAAHDYNAAGICTVCEYNSKTLNVGELTLEEAIAIALLRADKVVSGNIAEYKESATNIYNGNYKFELGGDYIYFSTEYTQSSYSDWADEWYEEEYSREEWDYVVGDVIWSIISEYGYSYKNNEEVPLDVVSGYRFDGSVVDYIVEGVYGTENFVAALYKYATENALMYQDFSAEITEATEGSAFAFAFGTVSGEYANVYVVAFTLEESNYYANNVAIMSYSFEIYDENGEINSSVITNVETDAEGNIIACEFVCEAEPAAYKAMNIEQFNYESDYAYSPDNNAALDFDVCVPTEDGYAEITETITVTVGQYQEWYIMNLKPYFADLDLDVIDVKFFDAAGEVTYTAYGSAYGDVIDATFYKTGSYTVEIKSFYVTKVINVEVVYAPTTEMYPAVNGENTRGETIYTGETLDFGVNVNESADPSFTATITSANASEATLTLNYDGTYTFEATLPGTYSIMVTSNANSDLTANFNITVKNPAPVVPADVFKDAYHGSDMWGSTNVVLYFTPNADYITGSVAVEINGQGRMGTYTYNSVYNYAYDSATRTINLTYVEGEELQFFFIKVDNEATLYVDYQYNQIDLETGDGKVVIDRDFFAGKSFTVAVGDKTWYLNFQAARNTVGGTVYLVSFADAPDRDRNQTFSIWFELTVVEEQQLGFMLAHFLTLVYSEGTTVVGTPPTIEMLFYDKNSQELVLVTAEENYYFTHTGNVGGR